VATVRASEPVGSSGRELPLAIDGRRYPAPALEGAGKDALLGETQQKGDIGDRLGGIVEIAQRQSVARFVEHAPVRQAEFPKFLLDLIEGSLPEVPDLQEIHLWPERHHAERELQPRLLLS